MDFPLVAFLLDGDVGDDDPVVVLRETAAGRGVELADLLDRGLHVVGGRAELAGQLGNTAAREQLKLIAEHAGGERIAAAAGGQLGEQALGEGLAADAGRVETLEELQRLEHGIVGQVGLQRDVRRGLGQIAAVIEIADELAQRFEDRRGELVERDLLHQVLLQGGFRGEGVEEMLPFFGVLRGVRLGAAGARQVVLPVLVELPENLEFLAEIHFLAVVALLGGGGVRRRLVG